MDGKVSVSCWRLVLLTESFDIFELVIRVSVSCWRLVLLTGRTKTMKMPIIVSVSCWRLVLLTLPKVWDGKQWRSFRLLLEIGSSNVCTKLVELMVTSVSVSCWRLVLLTQRLQANNNPSLSFPSPVGDWFF